MKSIIIILFLCNLCSGNLFSQKVTYKNLIGIWDTNDTTLKSPSTMLQFKDNRNVVWSVIPTGIDANLTYTLDTLSNPVLRHLQGISRRKIKIDQYWFVKNFTLIH